MGRDRGKLTSGLKPNPEDSAAFRQKNCDEKDLPFTASYRVDFAVWRSPHTAGNFYVDRTSSSANPDFQNQANRARGWCEWVRKVDC